MRSLATLVALLLKMNHIFPQVTLPAIGIFVVSGMSWHYARRKIAAGLLMTDLKEATSDPALDLYDVFISYSHQKENMEWVTRNVYEPLRQFKKKDGSSLRIFFDEKSIKIGTSWYKKIAMSIHGANLFVPIYSEDYFQRDFCRFEMERAAIKRVKKEDFILPVARVIPDIPVQYDHIQYIDAANKPDFIKEITAAIEQQQDV
jgi:hypothetical protein